MYCSVCARGRRKEVILTTSEKNKTTSEVEKTRSEIKRTAPYEWKVFCRFFLLSLSPPNLILKLPDSIVKFVLKSGMSGKIRGRDVYI